ncbi:MAG: 4Fe-4S dicluster domain-containing protein [Nitrososphaerales archaeon]
MPIQKQVLIFDPRLCDGCEKCIEACVKRFGTSQSTPAIKLIKSGDGHKFSLSFCLQCDEPFCRVICPTGSILLDEIRDVTFIRSETCVGCRSCFLICPVEGVVFDGAGKAVKCDLCNGDPLCVKVCERGALRYGFAEDLSTLKKNRVALLISSSTRAGVLTTNRGLTLSKGVVGDPLFFSQLVSAKSEGLRKFLDYCAGNLSAISKEATLATLSETVLKRRRSLGLSEVRRPKEEVQTILKTLSSKKGELSFG